jgi:hypothetical protein
MDLQSKPFLKTKLFPANAPILVWPLEGTVSRDDLAFDDMHGQF